MSRCSYCRCELPGLETVCDRCFQAGYDRLTHPQPWWRRLHPRFARANLAGFSVLFLIAFAIWRFDLPLFRISRMKSTDTSLIVAALFACIAFFVDPKEKADPPRKPGRRRVRLAEVPAFSGRRNSNRRGPLCTLHVYADGRVLDLRSSQLGRCSCGISRWRPWCRRNIVTFETPGKRYILMR